jgi:hypothetical protein
MTEVRWPSEGIMMNYNNEGSLNSVEGITITIIMEVPLLSAHTLHVVLSRYA